MIDITFNQGCGSGFKVVDYVVRDYSLKHTGSKASMEKGQRQKVARLPAPVVLRGNSHNTSALIDAIPFKNKYTSGVLDWSYGEDITPEAERQVMDAWESVHLAGLEQDQYDILWVRHSHAGHHELHYVIPKIELNTGKQLNPKPPDYNHELSDLFRRKLNLTYGWRDPDDLECARMYQIKGKYAETQRLIGEIIAQRDFIGLINSRGDVLQLLAGIGLEVAIKKNGEKAIGRDYISIAYPGDSSKNITLKGRYYCAEKYSYTCQPEAQSTIGFRFKRDHESIQRELDWLDKRLEQLVAKRAECNRQRFEKGGLGTPKIKPTVAPVNKGCHEKNDVAAAGMFYGDISDICNDRAIQPMAVSGKNKGDRTTTKDIAKVRGRYSHHELQQQAMRQNRRNAAALQRWLQGVKFTIAREGDHYDGTGERLTEWVRVIREAARRRHEYFEQTCLGLAEASCCIDGAIRPDRAATLGERTVEEENDDRGVLPHPSFNGL